MLLGIVGNVLKQNAINPPPQDPSYATEEEQSVGTYCLFSWLRLGGQTLRRREISDLSTDNLSTRRTSSHTSSLHSYVQCIAASEQKRRRERRY